jgi:hypothetical protein
MTTFCFHPVVSEIVGRGWMAAPEDGTSLLHFCGVGHGDGLLIFWVDLCTRKLLKGPWAQAVYSLECQSRHSAGVDTSASCLFSYGSLEQQQWKFTRQISLPLIIQNLLSHKAPVLISRVHLLSPLHIRIKNFEPGH